MRLSGSLTLIMSFFLLGACGELSAPDASSEADASLETTANAEDVAGGATSARIKALRARFETADVRDVMVVAHRSCWKNSPENSIASMQDCIELGVEMIEVDVRQTEDGALVIIHDETVDRTTNGTGRVENMTLADIRKLRLREGLGGPDAALTDQRVPTLDEVFDAVEGLILVNLDTKGEVLKASMAAVAARGIGDHVVFKSSLPSDSPVLRSMTLPAGSYFMPILREERGPLADQVAGFAWAAPEAYEVVFGTRAYFEANARAVTGTGERLWVNTLWDGIAADITDAAALEDPDGNWGYLFGHGVSMIQTDAPEALISYIESRASGE